MRHVLVSVHVPVPASEAFPQVAAGVLDEVHPDEKATRTAAKARARVSRSADGKKLAVLAIVCLPIEDS
jgi:hypothetical protein